MRWFLALLGFFNTLGCTTQPSPAIKATTLDEAAKALSRLTKCTVRPFATRDFGREQNPAARSVVIRSGDAAATVESLRSELGSGLLAFVGCTRSLAEPPDHGEEIVVALGETQFEILRVAQSDAINYDMETEDLVRKLQEYDTQFGIDIFHAETDTIEFRFRSPPLDLPTFCEDLYKFCPDIVDQGVGSVADLEKELVKTGRVYLWWD